MNLPPLAPEVIFHLGSFGVTNSQLNATVALGILVIVALLLQRKLSDVPGRLQGFFELVIETLLGYFDQVTNSRELSKKFLPFVGTIFIFVLLSNWMGLLPGTGSIGRYLLMHGEKELVPLFRPATSDLNLTVAIALIAVVGSHLVGMFTIGFFTHWNKFIQFGTIWKAVRSLKPMAIITALVEFLVGFIELFSEVAKVVSLSLRLFGNVFAGEVLITVISGLFGYLLPLPFMVLEIIVGVVQATVFSLLTLVYLTVASTKPHGDEHEGEHAHQPAEAHG